jgi:uncharacterized protein
VNAALTTAVTEFCTLLRERYGFAAGRAQAHDVIRATGALGLEDRARFKTAMRAICASRSEEIPVFDRAFDEYFSSGTPGVPQPAPARRFRRDGEEPPRERQSRYDLETESAADRWEIMRARYSPQASAAGPPVVPDDDFARADRLVKRLIADVRLGRSRRYRPHARGPRIDLRRTLRASLRTGEIVDLRRLARPPRNPRFMILIDASRSMSEHAAFALQVAYAFVHRTRRAHAFVFSTELRDVTRTLASIAHSAPHVPEGLGEAWGGGTRIGSSLATFVKRYRSRVTDDTYVIIVSDGLDVGDVGALRDAMREIARRAASVVWINPHAAQAGFEPTARGMQAVVPFIDELTVWGRIA